MAELLLLDIASGCFFSFGVDIGLRAVAVSAYDVARRYVG
jgi:hypothetical protein